MTLEKSSRKGGPVILIALAMVCLLLSLSSKNNVSLATEQDGASESADIYCESKVRHGELLFKLQQCSNDLDLEVFAKRLAAVQEALTDKRDDLILSRRSADCIFLLRAKNRTAEELMGFFQTLTAKSERVKVLLGQQALDDFTVTAFQPNFLIQIDENITATSASRTKHETGSAWWFDNNSPPGSGVTSAWGKYGKGSEEVIVAVLDTGIADHPELNSNLWVATTWISLPANGVSCKPGTKGFNVGEPGKICDPTDYDGHGTHVAGIIGATGQTKGVVGVSQKVTLLPIKIFDSSGYTDVDKVIRAIELVIQLRAIGIKVRVLNNSYSVPVSCDKMDVLRSKIQEIGDKDKNILFVAAAGQGKPKYGNNDTFFNYPSHFNSLSNVISVTAIDKDSKLALGDNQVANFGKTSVDLGAPGSNIYSTDLARRGYYSERIGTSMATPFVTGAVALMLSVRGCSELPASQIRYFIREGVARTDSLVDRTVTNGSLNVFASISKCAK